MIRLIAILILCIFTACGGSSTSNTFNSPTLLAVDSTNDRLFILEKEGILLLFKATDLSPEGTQPVISATTETTLHDRLPVTPTHMVVFQTGTTSRLFITGTQTINGDRVTNRVLVMDYDGSSLSEASFSPITVEDDDTTTSENSNVIGGMAIDATNSRLYVTDATGGRLNIYNTADGTEAAAEMAITGNPSDLKFHNGRLYVGNLTTTENDQLITVVNTEDFTTTTIDLDLPIEYLDVTSNDTGTVLLAKVARAQRVLVRTVDTTTFNTSTAMTAGNTSVADGEVNADNSISSAVDQLLLTKSSDGTVYGYVPQADGNMVVLTMIADLSSYTAQTLTTYSTDLGSIDVLVDSNGVGSKVYSTATASGELISTDVGSTTYTLSY